MKHPATKHGMYKSAEYRAWAHMKDRCGNERCAKWKSYGGRGISVCAKWKKFENFFADMGTRPSPCHSLGRIDNDGNYNKKNCRWETLTEQQNNLSNSRIIKFQGEAKTLSQWARHFGVRYGMLANRLHQGWSEDATLRHAAYSFAHDGRSINKPKLIKHDGKEMTASEWARLLKIPAHRIWYRMKKGMPMEKVLAINLKTKSTKA